MSNVTEEELEQAFEQHANALGLTDDVLLHRESSSNFLAHYGVKGMRWGVVRDKLKSLTDDGIPDGEVKITKDNGSKVKAAGGRKAPAHDDAVKVAVSKQKAKSSSTDSLSTKELQELVNRMNLEQQYKKLTDGQRSAGQKFVADTIGRIGKEQATQYLNRQVNEFVKKKTGT